MNGWHTTLVIAWMIIVVTGCGGGSDGSSAASAAASTPIPEIPDTDVVAPPAPPPVQPNTPGVVPTEVAAGTGIRLDAAVTESQPAPPSGDIRDVDFRTGFVYPVAFFEEPFGVSVIDGVYEEGDPVEDYLALHATAPSFGDLDGDGVEEASVATSLTTGGSGLFDTLHVYAIDGDRVVLRGSVGFGDRADGGLWHHEIVDGHLRTESFGTDQGACCPNLVTLSRFDLGAVGLVAAESFPTLRWLAVPSERDVADEIRFLPGTSAAVVNVHGFDDLPSAWFEAGAGQRLRVRHLRGPAPIEIGLVDRADRSTILRRADSSLEAVLPADGAYEIELGYTSVDRPGASAFVVTIDAPSAPAEPTWTTELRQVLVAEDPDVVLNAAVPSFGADAGGLHAELADWLDEQTEWWIADVTDFPPLGPLDDHGLGGEYELVYEVLLVTDQIVSVRWHTYEYVCCRPYPNLGQRALVLDLAAQRIVPVDEILDLARLDELHDRWFAVAAHDAETPLDRDLFFADGSPIFSAVTVVPGGVELGTDRLGALGPTSTYVSWAELGDLANAGFVARVADGVAPTGW